MPAVAERFKVRTRQTASRFQRVGSKIIKKTLQGTGVEWRGFHAFRRGLGTRLYNNGTPIETVAKVLRHGSGSEVTLKYYVEVEEETKAAAVAEFAAKNQESSEESDSTYICQPQWTENSVHASPRR